MSQIQIDFFIKLSALVGSKLLLTKEVARILPTSPKTANRMIAGTAEISMSELHKLAEVYHISLDEHFGFVKNNTPLNLLVLAIKT